MSHLPLPPYTINTPPPHKMHVYLIDKFSLIEPDDGQTLWPKHVVVEMYFSFFPYRRVAITNVYYDCQTQLNLLLTCRLYKPYKLL